jgi:excisionase family DNA binding protein
MHTTQDLETLTAADVAVLLKIEERTARRWMRDGKIPSFRIGEGKGGEVRTRRTDFEVWLAAQPRTSEQPPLGTS